MSKFKKSFLSYFFFITLVICVSAIIYAKIAPKLADFNQAADFPREALIYIQIRDLPSLINLWNESEFKKNYLESTNFAEFQNNHLALKLAERYKEISDSVGFFTDSNIFATISENKAAFAVYDIGKLEFVFVAPMSEEKILASTFFTNSSNFQEIKLSDGTVVYKLETMVDRQRQNQKIFFTSFRGRFILATSEKYFLQTLEIIQGKTKNNRLSEAPNFKRLADKTTPNLVTVWLNQTSLNADWYFKHYGLISDNEKLKNLQSGMFDFELQTEKLVEKRVFLTNSEISVKNIKPEISNSLLKLIPENIPFYQIKLAEPASAAELISEILFNGKVSDKYQTSENPRTKYFFDDWGQSYSYQSLGSDFGKQIDENEDESTDNQDLIVKNQTLQLSQSIGKTQPVTLAKLSSPQSLPSPLFFDNRQAVIISVQKRGEFDGELLEKSINAIAENHLTVGNLNAEFDWKDLPIDEFKVRQLKMPSLGWSIFYALKNNQLILANSEELMTQILTESKARPKFDNSFSEFSSIDLTRRESAYDDIFIQIAGAENRPTSSDFFAGNIAGLLEVISAVEKIEIKQKSEQDFLDEEIDFILTKPGENK